MTGSGLNFSLSPSSLPSRQPHSDPPSAPPRKSRLSSSCLSLWLRAKLIWMAGHDLDTVRHWIDTSMRIVAFTGAGISTESGIPDFRGPQGVWPRDPKAERLSDIRYYMSDPKVRKLAWQRRLDHPGWSAAPNKGHLALVELERRGKLHALVTQNIDGL